MPILAARLLALLWACLLGTSLIAASPEARTESSADQVIVKFTSQSDAGRALAQMDLATIGDPAQDARLVELAQDFGERIGVPVRLESLTSGRELLLAVDRDALAAAVAARLRQREGVTSVEVAEPTTGAGGEPASPRLTVGLEPGSPFAARLARESRSRAGASARRRPGRAGCAGGGALGGAGPRRPGARSGRAHDRPARARGGRSRRPVRPAQPAARALSSWREGARLADRRRAFARPHGRSASTVARCYGGRLVGVGRRRDKIRCSRRRG